MLLLFIIRSVSQSSWKKWTEEVKEKMMVMDVTDKKRQTTIALIWGGKDIKDIKDFAV